MSGSPERLSAVIEDVRHSLADGAGEVVLRADEVRAFLSHIDALQAENERMEAALREMAEMGHFSLGGSPTMSSYPETHRKRCPGCIAESALSESSR